MIDESLKNQQQFYNDVWRKGLEAGKEERGNLKTNLDFIAKVSLLKRQDRILEIGCGIGSVVFELSRQGYDITGIDISSEAISYGLEKYGGIKLQVQAAEELVFEDEMFDVVMSFDLLEHIARVDTHIAEVCRVLRTGGYYLFQTPNKYSNVLFETLSQKSLRWRRSHPSLQTPGQLKRRLLRHGFEARFVKMNPINEFTLSKLEKVGLLGRILSGVDFCRLPVFLQTNLYVVARKL